MIDYVSYLNEKTYLEFACFFIMKVTLLDNADMQTKKKITLITQADIKAYKIIIF